MGKKSNSNKKDSAEQQQQQHSNPHHHHAAVAVGAEGPANTHPNAPVSTSAEESDRQKNIRVVRLRYGGKRWEVPVFFNGYKTWREEECDEDDFSDGDDEYSSDEDGKHGKKKKKGSTKKNNNSQKDEFYPLSPLVLQKMLVTDRIFANSYKRETAKDTDIRKTFPGKSFDQVASFVLRRGEIVEIQQDRTQEHKQVAAAVQDAISHAFVMVFNKFTGELFEKESEFGLAIKPFIPVMRTLLGSSPLIMSSGSSTHQQHQQTSAAAAAPLRFEAIWRVASWLARQSILDTMSTIADEAAIVPPVLIPLTFESSIEIKNSGENQDDFDEETKKKIEQQQVTNLKNQAVAKLKTIVETDWSGMMKMMNGEAEVQLVEEEKKAEGEETKEEHRTQKVTLKMYCLVAGHHLNVPDKTYLHLNWFHSIAQSLFDQTSWKLQIAEGKSIDSFDQPEVISAFLKEPFDLSLTLSLPHHSTAGVAEAMVAVNSNNSLKEEKHHHHQKSSQNAASIIPSDRKMAVTNKKKRQSKKNLDDDSDFTASGGSDNDDGGGGGGANKKKLDKYDAMSHRDLQAACKKNGLSTGGKKADLMSRLRNLD